MEINNLLNLVSKIKTKHIEVAKQSGERFNIFSVLKLTSDEVRLHSRFIGELLNPSGSHEQSGLFLQLFLKEVGLENEYTEAEIRRAHVLIEENIGQVSDDYEKGGRIDLVIKFPNFKKPIVIENKIWAQDQKKQLWRYFQQYNNSHIYYLTPTGHNPSEDSLFNLPLDSISIISYKEQINKWIQSCLKESVNKPLLREALNHYLNIIKIILKQTNENIMKEEIAIKIIESGNIQSAIDIGNSINTLKEHIMAKFKNHIIELANKNEMSIKFYDEHHSLGYMHTAFVFSKGLLYDVNFYFDSNFDDLIVGIVDKDDNWVKDSNEKLCVPFTRWDDFLWEDVYLGNEMLLSSVLETANNYFNEIKIKTNM
jgi:hypothetical protein